MNYDREKDKDWWWFASKYWQKLMIYFFSYVFLCFLYQWTMLHILMFPITVKIKPIIIILLYLPPVNTWIIDYCHWGKSAIRSIIKASDGCKVKPTNAGRIIQNHDKGQYPCDMSNLWKYSFSYFWCKYYNSSCLCKLHVSRSSYS